MSIGQITIAIIVNGGNIACSQDNAIDTEVIQVLGKSLIVATVTANISNVIPFGSSELSHESAIDVKLCVASVKGSHEMLPSPGRRTGRQIVS